MPLSVPDLVSLGMGRALAMLWLTGNTSSKNLLDTIDILSRMLLRLAEDKPAALLTTMTLMWLTQSVLLKWVQTNLPQ